MTEQEALEVLKGEFDIIIPNFKKWNPDTRGRRHWFAVSTDFFRDPKMAKCNMSERSLFIHLVATRASSESHLVATSLSVVCHSYRIRVSDGRRWILKLLKLQLIDLRLVRLHTYRHNIQDREDRDLPPPPTPHEGLKGVEDELFSKMSLSAQESWIKEFGLEFLRKNVPHYYSCWKTERPQDRYGNIKPAPMWIRNCLSNELKFNKPEKSGLEEWLEDQKQKELK